MREGHGVERQWEKERRAMTKGKEDNEKHEDPRCKDYTIASEEEGKTCTTKNIHATISLISPSYMLYTHAHSFSTLMHPRRNWETKLTAEATCPDLGRHHLLRPHHHSVWRPVVMEKGSWTTRHLTNCSIWIWRTTTSSRGRWSTTTLSRRSEPLATWMLPCKFTVGEAFFVLFCALCIYAGIVGKRGRKMFVFRQ